MDKLTSYDICTKYGCLSRIFTLIAYIVFISSFLCLTIIVIFLVVYTYLRYGDKKQ